MSMTNSFNNTITSNSLHVNQVFPLKYILKNCPITRFEISNFNSDGTIKKIEVIKEIIPGKKVKGGKTNAQKI